MPAAFGLPDSIRACLFDLDGVLTRTATVHFAAWKRTFDEFLRAHDPLAGEFTQADYNACKAVAPKPTNISGGWPLGAAWWWGRSGSS